MQSAMLNPCPTSRSFSTRIKHKTFSRHGPVNIQRRRATEQEKMQNLFSNATLDEVTKEVLRNDPVVAAQLLRFEDAAMRVAKAQAALQEVNDMMAQAATAEADSNAELEQKASEMLAAAEVKAAEKRMQAAELELALAEASKTEYQRSMQREADRAESGKAGAIAAFGGALSSVPLLFTSSISDPLSLFLTFGTNAAACVLFGVTYRYAVREDFGDTQLRLGVMGAFGLVRGLAAADVLQQVAVQQGESPISLDVIGPAALAAGQNMLLFLAAGTVLEVALREGWLKPRASS